MYSATTICAASRGRGVSVMLLVVRLAVWIVGVTFTVWGPESFADCCASDNESVDMLFL